MKKITLVLVALMLVASAGFAQKGKFTLGGELNFNNNSSSYDGESGPSSNDFKIMVSGHYNVMDNLALGLGLGYGSEKQYRTTILDKDYFNKSSKFYLQPSAIYFVRLGDKFAYAPKLFVDLGFGSLTKEQPITDSEYSTFDFGVGVDLLSFDFYPTDNIGLNIAAGTLQYTSESSTPDGGKKSSDNKFGLNLNNGLLGAVKLTFKYTF